MAYIYPMEIEKEEAFIKYWEENGEIIKNSKQPFLVGFSAGLGLGICILLLSASGWYSRANMVANAQFNPLVMLLIIIAIGLFIAYFYRNYKYDQLNTQYLEFVAKKKRRDKAMQQNRQENSLPQ